MRNRVEELFSRLSVVLSLRLAKTTLVTLWFAWVLTALGLIGGLFKNDDPLIVALFQNWMGDVIFFTLISAALAVFSTLPPELETFERRAGILFRGKSGDYVEFAEQQLRQLGNYSAQTHITIQVSDDEQHEEWIRLTTTTTLLLKNLIEDLITTVEFRVSDPSQDENPASKTFRIITFSIDGLPQVLHASGQANAQRFAYRVALNSESARQVEMTTESWIKDGGDVAHTPLRFTSALSVSIINRSARQITVTRRIPEQEPRLKLPAKGKEAVLVFPSIQGARPGRIAYHLKLSRTRRRRVA